MMSSSYPDDVLVAIEGLPAPAGQVSDLNSPSPQETYVLVTVGLCITFSTVFIVMRCWTKFIFTRSHGWEDCTYS